MLTLVLVVVLAALVFEYINGFHDTANSIATVVATKVLSPMQAVVLAAGMNLFGALWGTAVAKTIASGIIDAGVVDVTSQLILCALLGGIVWNLITWCAGIAVLVVARADRRPVRRGAGRGLEQLGRASSGRKRRRAGLEERRRAVEGRRADGDLAAAGLPRRLS